MDQGESALDATLSGGADVNEPDPMGYAPIHHAVIRGDRRLLEVVLAHGAKVDLLNGKKESALFLAAALGKVDCLYLLLLVGADPNIHIPPNGTTPLFEATLSAPVEVVQLLLEHGADPNAHNGWNETALHAAAKIDPLRSEAMTRLLLAHGADPDARDLRGYSALHVAASRGNLAPVRVFEELGRDLNGKTPLGSTPLDVAIDNDSAVVADWLYRLGGRAATTPDFEPPLHRAARVDDLDGAQVLLAFGADPAEVFDGASALEMARAHDSRRVARLLALAGARH